jgi:hypothetical protein
MGLADTSQTERIRMLRARTLAIARRASPANPAQQGPGWQTLDESVRVLRSVGQRIYTRMNAGDSKTVIPPCCPQ